LFITARFQSIGAAVRSKVLLYWPLIKSLQTGLLLMTGIAGYLSARAQVHRADFIQLVPSLVLAISGSTVLNMWWDRDIDAKMRRTRKRPTSAGLVSAKEVLALGLIIATIGIAWAFWINMLYGVVVLAGLFFDVVVYSIWLKRRTCWSIVWGGISGAMPILSGRVLAVGRIDPIGILLALAILFWIPTHTLTFSLKFSEDYQTADVPTFPSTYGTGFTRLAIAASTALAALAMSIASLWIGVAEGILALIIVLSAVLLFLAATVVLRPSENTNFRLYRYASLYMLCTMLLIIPYKL
jgi:heme o synthase